MSQILKRNQLVFLGAGQVGKTSIIQRFLDGIFCSEHRETVEDLYCREFDHQRHHIKVNFLDTAGSIAFPAMRSIYVRHSDAFVFVYSITNRESFLEMKEIWNHVKTTRTNYEDIPCVVVGNKFDCENGRQVENFEALNWATSEMLGGVFLEVSAKTNLNIDKIFKLLFDQLINPRSNISNSLPVLIKRIESIYVHDDSPDLKRKRTMCFPIFRNRKSFKKKTPEDDCIVS